MNSSVVAGLSSSGLLTLEYAHGPLGVSGKCGRRVQEVRSGALPADKHPMGQQRLASLCVGFCLLDIPWYFQIFCKERIAYFDGHGDSFLLEIR